MITFDNVSMTYPGQQRAALEDISVDIDEEHRIASVTVPERMLSLAIGREGQNARLAARLTGWRIDIRSDVSVAEAKAAAADVDTAVAETPVAEAESVTAEVALAVTVDVEAAHQARPGDRALPHARVHGATPPQHVLRHPDVDRQQGGHQSPLSSSSGSFSSSPSLSLIATMVATGVLP